MKIVVQKFDRAEKKYSDLKIGIFDREKQIILRPILRQRLEGVRGIADR